MVKTYLFFYCCVFDTYIYYAFDTSRLSIAICLLCRPRMYHITAPAVIRNRTTPPLTPIIACVSFVDEALLFLEVRTGRVGWGVVGRGTGNDEGNKGKGDDGGKEGEEGGKEGDDGGKEGEEGGKEDDEGGKEGEGGKDGGKVVGCFDGDKVGTGHT